MPVEGAAAQIFTVAYDILAVLLTSTTLYSPRFLWLIIGILLLAAAARILGAGSFPVWTDEGWSIWAISTYRLDTIVNILAADRHPPLYFLSLSAWSALAGDSRLALRLPAIFGGIVTVAITFRIGADVFGKRAGAFSALLLAVLGSAVYYAQEVRHYGWLTLFTALTWLCFLRYLRAPKRGIWLGYIASVTLLMYTQYFGLLALAMQAVIGLFLWPASFARKRGLVAAWSAAALLYAPWLLVILIQQAGILGSGIAGFPGTYEATPANLLPLAQLLFGEQAAVPLALYALGAWAILRPGSRRQRWNVLRRGGVRGGLVPHNGTIRRAVLLGGAGLFLVMFVISTRFDFLAARTLVFLTPLLMVVCGYGLALIEGRAAAVFTAAFVLVSLAAPQVIQERLNSDTAAQAVAEAASPGDLVVLEAGWDDNAFAYELSLALPDGVEIVRTLPWTNDRTGGDPVVPQIADRLAAHPRVWVVQWLQAPQVLSYLQGGGLGFREVIGADVPAGAYGVRFGDATIRARLFEHPTADQAPLVFGDLLALHDAVVAPAIAPGESLHVDLWWSALEPIPVDYSVGVYLLDANGVTLAEHNAAPAAPTNTWTPEALVFDRHTLVLPPDLAEGTYRIAVSIYWYADPTPLPVGDAPYAVTGEVRVTSAPE